MMAFDRTKENAPVTDGMTDAERIDALRARLRTSGVLLAWFSMGSVPLTEIGATRGFDAAVIDLQHGLWDRLGTHLAAAIFVAPPIIARVATNSLAAIGEALDSGACGVLVPLVETAEHAAAAVSAALFPPRGTRSGGGVRPVAQGFARYHAAYSAPLIGVMIETKTGLGNAAAIAAVPGIDFVFIGTGDLALSIGCFPDADDRLEQACTSVLSTCLEAGVPCGIFTTSAEAASRRLSEGYAVVVGANDIDIVAAGFSRAAELARSGDGQRTGGPGGQDARAS